MSRREISLPRTVPDGASQIPCAVIVGRPNVGKSSLLNCLARQRISIVDPTAGVTRDRISAVIEHQECLFELWDTGGIGTPDDLVEEIESQIEAALARADIVLFVVDVQEGLLPFDRDIAKQLRRIGRPVLLVANKVDHARHEESVVEFHSLGFGEPMCVSALHRYGRTDLLDKLVESLPEAHVAPTEPVLRLAFVGRRNVGKSTLVNTLVREQRVIVSDVPGTTRDAVDVRFQHRDRTFVAVDTAGIRRKGRAGGPIEFYSLARAHRAIRRCDVALHMVDAKADISKVDKQLAATLDRECTPCILTVNKWDLAEERITTDQYIEYLNDRLPILSFAPVSFISAKDRTNIDATLDLAESLFKQARVQVQTSELNTVLKAAVERHGPDVRHNKQPKLFYATQIGVAPPTILIFASHPQLITERYTRYLQNHFRARLPFPEIPLRIIFRARSQVAPKKP